MIDAVICGAKLRVESLKRFPPFQVDVAQNVFDPVERDGFIPTWARRGEVVEIFIGGA